MKTKEERELLRNKFNFFVENYTEGVEEIRKKIGIDSSGTLNSFRSPTLKQSISQPYIESFEKHYQIPTTIWEKKFPFNKEKINRTIERYRKELEQKSTIPTSSIYHNPFESIVSDKTKRKLLKILQGRWYVYIHKEESDDIWIVELNIDEWGIVTYPNNNGKGFVNIRPRSSYIEKTTALNETTVLIRFSNKNISYKIFYASVNTIDMGDGKPILNFAFFARKEYLEEEAKEILGSYKQSQLKLDLKFHQRVAKEHQY